MYIKTERLELKSISPDSLDALVELLTDETVKKTYMVPDFPNPEGARQLARRLIALSGEENRHVAGIYLEGRLTGILNKTESGPDWVEVGYAILPRWQNRGFCTEALRGAIGYFFGLGYRQVLAGAFAENAASIRVMVKCGMEKLDRQEQIEYRGRTHSCVYYAARQ